jgi:alpha-methylacyl-CoA racemase
MSETRNLFLSKTLQEWVEISQQCDACLEPVLSPMELISHPQHIARNVFLQPPSDSPSPPSRHLPPQMVLGPRLSNHPSEYLHRARRLGEDTDEVMKEDGGYTQEEVDLYRQTGAIA